MPLLFAALIAVAGLTIPFDSSSEGPRPRPGEIRLARAPVARGIVRRSDGKPLAGAVIRAGESELARSDARGVFVAEIPEPRPDALLVSAHGWGTKVIPLPGGDVDVVAPPLTMRKASSLAVTVEREPSPVEVTLQRWDDDQRVDVAHRHLARDAASVAFDDLDEGTYAVIVRGVGPLAIAATKLNVAAGERRRASIAVRPQQVDWTASLGEKPLAGITLAFSSNALHWRAEVTTDAAGRFAAELWQPGPVLVTARGGPLSAPFTINAELRPGHFDFVIPDRQVRGRLLDRDSGRGVPGAFVFLRSTHGTVRTNPRTTTAADGSFLFNAVAPGEQHLTSLAPGFLIPDPVDFTTREGDPPHSLDIVLDSGAPHALRIFLHDGRPAAGAELVAAVGDAIRAISSADADGRATVPMPRDAEAKIYVIPREGTFAVVDRDADHVTLRPPSSSLRIVARALDGTPLAGIAMLMSYDGRVIPPSVAQRISRMQGLPLITNDEGELVLRNIPPGWYEFWPYRGEEEAHALLLSMPEAPIALNVKTGENAVAVDFQRVR